MRRQDKAVNFTFFKLHFASAYLKHQAEDMERGRELIKAHYERPEQLPWADVPDVLGDYVTVTIALTVITFSTLRASHQLDLRISADREDARLIELLIVPVYLQAVRQKGLSSVSLHSRHFTFRILHAKALNYNWTKNCFLVHF